MEYSDRKAKRFGSVAILTAAVRTKGGSKVESYENSVRIIHVWVDPGDGWQLVAHQSTRLP